jgi:autotransporter-associated beta strand protein
VPASLDPVNITLENGGVLFNNDTVLSLDANRGIRIGPGGGGMLAGFGANVTVNGPISGDAGNPLTILGNQGTVIWTGTNTFAGQLVVRGNETFGSGRLQVGTGGTSGTLGTGPVEIQTGGLITFNRADEIVVSNVISGGGTIVKEGTGTLVLSGNNSFGSGTFSYGGGSSQNRGAIRLASGTALGNFTTINLIGADAGKRQIQLSGGNTYGYEITTSGLQNPQADGAALVNVDGANVWNGSVSIAATGGAYGIRSDAGTLTINGAVQRTLSLNDTRNWEIGGAGDVVVNGAVQVVSAQGVMGLLKFGSGSLVLNNAANTYSGATTVGAGKLLVNGVLANTSGVTVNAGAVLGGSGSIAATIAGAGLVSPGNSPGITTASAVNPTGGLGFAFEFTAPGSPDYTAPAASLNDVLRLTSGTPFTAALTGSNPIDVYFDVATLGGGDTFRGGFYTDLAGDFLPSIENATYSYWVRGDGSGTDRTFNGQGFYSLANFGVGLSVAISTAPESADFGAGTINGQVSQFVVVPEPASLALIAATAAAGWLVGRRRHASGS